MNRNSFLTVAAAAVASFTMTAAGEVIASWSMPTAVPAATTGQNYTYGFADGGTYAGTASLSSYHALSTAVYSSPAGNGSQYSFSSNGWSIGDYYEVFTSTWGASGVSVSWDQTRSGTGPGSFELMMSVDGNQTFTQVTTYTVLQAGLAGSNTTSWNAVTNQPAFTTTVALGATADNGYVTLRFRSLVATAAAGTNRIDNIIVSGVPAPGAIALLGLAGLLSNRRR